MTDASDQSNEDFGHATGGARVAKLKEGFPPSLPDKEERGSEVAESFYVPLYADNGPGNGPFGPSDGDMARRDRRAKDNGGRC